MQKTRGIIKITGADSTKFLQSLVTNDITSANVIYALLLSPQGRFLHDFFIYKVVAPAVLAQAEIHEASDYLHDDTILDSRLCRNDTSEYENNIVYLIDIDITGKQTFIETIKKYVLRAKVFIEDISDEYAIMYSRIARVDSYKDPRMPKLGYRTIVRGEDESLVEYIEDKYKYTIPDGAIDLIYNRSMPQEYGLDLLGGISYIKGCYVGQELISRTKSRGVIRKKIMRVESDEDISALPKGSPILADGTEIGTLCSAYNNVGIAIIRTDIQPNFQRMRLTINNISVSLSIPEWY